VTDKLRETMRLMQQELDKSMLSSQMLEQSTATLNLTSNQHTTYSSLLSTSKALISSLEKGDVLDRVIIGAAFLFFVFCVLLILKRRVLDRGVGVVTTVGSALLMGGSKSASKLVPLAEKPKIAQQRQEEQAKFPDVFNLVPETDDERTDGAAVEDVVLDVLLEEGDMVTEPLGEEETEGANVIEEHIRIPSRGHPPGAEMMRDEL